GDFGGATSSASSKLIHGGLRYLRLGDVGLVREAHQERRVLMSVVAPHLVRRLPFLFPLYEEGPYRPWFVQSGILVYSTLARPGGGFLLPAPTDTEHGGEPESARVTDDDVQQVLDEAALAVDGLGPPRASFCGLRVLPGGHGETASAKRETVFSTGPSGMVS